jgi:hypothetical protein
LASVGQLGGVETGMPLVDLVAELPGAAFIEPVQVAAPIDGDESHGSSYVNRDGGGPYGGGMT